ncbi:hypothetical protein [Ornithinimicrobium kibberense]|uniref:Lipoprotein n=1 Tax=Ornithinimicrobium kibberense TaxID=282060 RepID=A0ABV5V149_9MICO|nr:hypothetical protein [Ornithinimicrobium kibberense]
MRRTPVIAATAALLALSACSGSGTPGPTSTAPATEGSPDAAPATGGAASTEGPGTSSAPAPGGTPDGADVTAGPDQAGATVDPDEVEGGADGQAAADVARQFLVAMVDADAAACDHMISFTDVQTPMVQVEEDYALCTELLPAVLAEEVDAQGLDEDGATLLEALQITGADVDGDTAVVDGDNVSPLFADSLGQETITLTRVEGRWYVDLERSFEPPAPR